MKTIPVLRHVLPHRAAGSFGFSAPGRVAEWATATWFRLEVTLTCVLVLLAVMSADAASWRDRIAMLLVSPALSIALVITLKIMGWVSYFIPGPDRLFGWSRVAFLWLFSRLVAEPAPELEMPLWLGSRR